MNAGPTTQRKALRLLAIGTDADLLRPVSSAVGDALQRQLKYASVLDDYHMIVRSLGTERGALRPGPGLTVHPSASFNRATFPLDAFRLGSVLQRRLHFDLVSTEDPMLCGLAGYLLRRRFDLPLSVQLAGDMLDNPYWLADRPINPYLNLLGKAIVRSADSVRVVSSSEREKMIQLGVAPDRVEFLGWMGDFSRFQQANGSGLRRQLLTTPFQKLVLFVGRLVKQKDLPTLLDAAARVHRVRGDTRFVLAGNGEEMPAARRLVAALGLEQAVVLLGAVPHEALPDYYSACDIFLLPSRYEGNARVLAEAAAAAKPSVTCEVSGARDTVLDGESGYVVPIGRADLLAERLLELLEDSARAEAMGRSAQQHVLDLYSDARILTGFQNFWSATAARRIPRV